MYLLPAEDFENASFLRHKEMVCPFGAAIFFCLVAQESYDVVHWCYRRYWGGTNDHLYLSDGSDDISSISMGKGNKDRDLSYNERVRR